MNNTSRRRSIVCVAALAAVMLSPAVVLAQDPTPRTLRPAMAGRTATLNTEDGFIKLRLRDDALFDVEAKIKERELLGRGMLLALEESAGDSVLYAVVYDKNALPRDEQQPSAQQEPTMGLEDHILGPSPAPTPPPADESPEEELRRETMEANGGIPPIELRIRILSDSEIEAQFCETRFGRMVREGREAIDATGRAVVDAGRATGRAVGRAGRAVGRAVADTPALIVGAVIGLYTLTGEGVRELVSFVRDAASFLRHVIVDVVYRDFIVDTLAKQVVRDFLLKRVLRDIVVRKVFGEILIKKVFVEVLGKKVLRDAIGKKFFRDWIWNGGIKRFGRFVGNMFRTKKPCDGRVIHAEVEIVDPAEERQLQAFLREQDPQDSLFPIEQVLDQVTEVPAAEGIPTVPGAAGQTR